MKIEKIIVWILLIVQVIIYNGAHAQNLIIEHDRDVVTSGQNAVPTTVHADTTFIFKGGISVYLKPNFHTSGYNTGVANDSYFRAYINRANYATLKKELDDYYYPMIDGGIHFRYDEKYVDAGNLDYKIYDFQRNAIATNLTYPIEYVGANFYSIDLRNVTTFMSRDFNLEQNKYYILEVKDRNGELWKLRFKYIQ